ncbi:MAG: DegT/DnrJ/EryC1/StrS family aminotransferase, partial [Acidimicrobiales bacterium]
MIDRRAAIRERYETALGDLPGVTFNPIDDRGVPNHWLTIAVLADDAACAPDELIDALEAADIEARRAWKPMHRQPVFAEATMFGGAVADDVFRRGVCLPSGSGMDDADLDRVIEAAVAVLRP